MRVLVLGGYGLIGRAVVREPLLQGAEVAGTGRSPAHGLALFPSAAWLASVAVWCGSEER